MSKIPNRLWCAPPRAANPNAEQERQERANDPALLEAIKNYKVSSATAIELSKYKPTILTAEMLFMVLP